MELGGRMELILNGLNIKNKEQLYFEIKKQLNNDELIGDNLDALFEVLLSYNTPLRIQVKNYANLHNNLQGYSVYLIKVFKDAVDENKNITLDLK